MRYETDISDLNVRFLVILFISITRLTLLNFHTSKFPQDIPIAVNTVTIWLRTLIAEAETTFFSDFAIFNSFRPVKMHADCDFYLIYAIKSSRDMCSKQ